MATLKKRRDKWYARVFWYDNTGMKKEKQVPLRTKSKVTARERLVTVNRLESDIKDGIAFSFPWMNDEGASRVIRFTVGDAIKEWINRKSKNGVRPKTLEIYDAGLQHFINYLGVKLPLRSVTTTEIDGFCDYMKGVGLSVTSINMYLRVLKSMFRCNMPSLL